MDQMEEALRADGFDIIIGVDEAGRGPLAGPVVAAAVAFSGIEFQSVIRDSKKLSPLQREKAFCEIYEKAHVGLGVINEQIIDDVNILEASYFAMQNAIIQLVNKLPDKIRKVENFNQKVCVLVDGNCFKPVLPFKTQTVVQGDSKVRSIACASIIAKVSRDRILATYDKIYPQYGFKQHKGYPTADHRAAIKEHGLSEIHRRTFSH